MRFSCFVAFCIFSICLHAKSNTDSELAYRVFKNEDPSFRTNVESTTYGMCMSLSTGLQCLGRLENYSLPPVIFERTDLLSMYRYGGCAVVDQQLKCWGGDFLRTVNLKVLNPSNIFVLNRGVCIVENGSTRCLGDADYRWIERLSDLTNLTFGYNHICALHAGQVTCKGDNSEGQVEIPNISNATLLAARGDSNCVVQQENKLTCWGGEFDKKALHVELTNPQLLTMRYDDEVCVLDDSLVRCWKKSTKLEESKLVDYIEENEFEIPESIALKSPTKLVQLQAYLFCIADVEGVMCFENHPYLRRQALQDLAIPISGAISIHMGNEAYCVSDDAGKKCRKLNGYPVNADQVISVGYGHYCGISDNKVGCLGHSNTFGQLNVPYVKNPTKVVSGTFHSCAMGEEGVKCWGSNQYGQSDVPPLNNPAHLAADNDTTCVIDSGEVVCWGWGNTIEYNQMPELVEPFDLVVSGHTVCALDLEGFKCASSKIPQDYLTKPPFELSNPRSLAASDNTICVLDDFGQKCWGLNFIFSPNSGSNKLVNLVRRAIEVSAPLKSTFLESLRSRNSLSLLNTPFQYEDGILEKALFVLKLLRPTIHSSDSRVFREEIIPAFDDFWLSVEQAPYRAIFMRGESKDFKKMALLEFLQVCIQGAELILTENEQEVLLPLKKDLAIGLSGKPSDLDMSKILRSLDIAQPTIEKLSRSQKTQFLYETIVISRELAVTLGRSE